MISKYTLRLVAGLFALAIAFGAAGNASAESVAEFYKGKKITLYVGFSAGGAFDIRARILARHLPRHIPGNPKVVVQNMPGAGSMKLANYIFNTAPRDGTEIAGISEAMSMNTLFKTPGTKFNAIEFTWLGSLVKDPATCAVWHKAKVKSFADLYETEFIVGATGAGSTTNVFPLAVKNLLGVKIRPITGYQGSQNILLAIESGEVDGICGLPLQSLKKQRPEWLKDGKLKIIAQLGLSKDPEIADAPLVLEFAKDKESREALELVFGSKALGNPYIAPPGIPADRREALRRAYDATVADPAFLADAAKAKIKVRPGKGEEIDALLARFYSAPEQVVARAAKAVKPAPK